jgi:hypothetical protein
MSHSLRRRPAPRRSGDRRFVDDIVAELKKDGPLSDPWTRLPDGSHPYAGMAPAGYVGIEVQRSIDRVRLRCEPPPYMPKIAATVADYHRLGRLLCKMGKAQLAERLGASDHVVQEPPPRADAAKHYCAAEAFDLMELFSATAPTFSEGRPFQVIAQKLYEATTCQQDASLERACDWVLTARGERRKARWPEADA